MKYCCVYNCPNKQTPNCNIYFHCFPLTNAELTARWVHVIRRNNFKPNEHSRICQFHFLANDYCYSDSKKLKQGTVPSVFDYPKNMLPSTSNGKKRKAPKIRSENVPNKVSKRKENEPIKTPGRPSASKTELKKKLKTLQQKLRRKEQKIDSLKSLLRKLNKNKIIDEETMDKQLFRIEP